MVTIGMNYRVKPGKEDVFEGAFRRVLEAIRAAPGHDDSRLYREVDAEAPAYLIVSRWSDEAAFRTFIASDTFRKVSSWGLDNVLAGRPSHTTYQEAPSPPHGGRPA